MLARTLTLTISLSTLASASTWGLGSNWFIGSTVNSSPNSDSTFGTNVVPVEIVKVETTFNPGVPPTGQLGELILWPGLSNGTGDLLQTTIESWPDQSWCGGSAGDWCIRTSVYTASRQKHDGTYAALPANTPVKITFERSSDGVWTQAAAIGNKVISSVMSSSGPMTLFGIVTQCDDYCAGTVSSQSYVNTTITLSSASPTWGGSANVGTGSGVYGDGTATVVEDGVRAVWGRIESTDGGKTWKINEITAGVMTNGHTGS